MSLTPGFRKGKLVHLDLIDIGDGCTLDRPCGERYLRMKAAAALVGVYWKTNCGHRAHGRQQELFAKYIADLHAWEAMHNVKLHSWQSSPGNIPPPPTPAAVPGYSNHEDGSGADIQRKGHPDVDKWLAEHAHEFDFYRTVPSEMWHFSCQPWRAKPMVNV